jgi:hypothetical protein
MPPGTSHRNSVGAPDITGTDVVQEGGAVWLLQPVYDIIGSDVVQKIAGYSVRN